MRAGAGRGGGDDHELVGARRVGHPRGDGLVVAAGRRVRLVPQRHDQRFTGLGAGVGEADDRLAVEELTHQVAEVRRVDECSAVLDLAGAADDGGLAEGLDGRHPAECGDQPVGEQPGQHRRDPRRLVGQVVRRTRAHPGVVHHGGDAGLLRRTDGSCTGLRHHHLAVDDQLTDADVGSRTALLHATEQ